MFRSAIWVGLIVAGFCVSSYILAFSYFALVEGTSAGQVVWISYFVFALASMLLLFKYLVVPSSGRLAADGFYFLCGLIVSGILGGIGGLLGKLDGNLKYLDVELSIVPWDPSEVFIVSVVLLPIFVFLRMASEALEVYLQHIRAATAGGSTKQPGE